LFTEENVVLLMLSTQTVIWHTCIFDNVLHYQIRMSL